MSQNACIESHLKRSWLTPIQALTLYGCLRLGARIWELRQQGKAVRSKWVVLMNGKRVKAYRLG